MESRSGPVVHEVPSREAVPEALNRLGLQPGRPVLVSIGGAAGMTDDHMSALRRLLEEHVVPVLVERGAAVVDGGTRSGVMRVMGEVVSAAGSGVPLVGVAATGTVCVPGRASLSEDAAELDPGHTVVLLVPGTEWGDESPWIAAVAGQLADSAPSVTLLVNGGEVAYADVEHSIHAGRPVLVLAGTGRTADILAAALRGEDADPRALELLRSGIVQTVGIDQPAEVASLLNQLLASE